MKADNFVKKAEEFLDLKIREAAVFSDARLYLAMQYALEGGKRVRPSLMALSTKMFGANEEEVVPFAAAIEAIHAYSLIHDDLPAMDDDDMRRGKPTVHRKFGEAEAILAGDALLNTAYEIMLAALAENPRAADAAEYIAKAAGAIGMVGGQAAELSYDFRRADMDAEAKEAALVNIYMKKTGALISASIFAPYLLSDRKADEGTVLRVSKNIGLIFQLVDDLIDSTTPSGKLKPTLVGEAGVPRVKELIDKYHKETVELLNEFGQKAAELADYAERLSKRVV
jgi:Geranylgeranyl pyrophosphate synthase